MKKYFFPVLRAAAILLVTGLWLNPLTVHAGLVEVVNGSNATVDQFSTSGNPVGSLGSGIPLRSPQGIAVNSAGVTFVSEYMGNDIQKFGANGAALGTFASGLINPRDIAVDSAGNVYVVNSANGWGNPSAINEYAPNGNLLNSISLGYYVDWPGGLAVNNNGDVFVANFNNGTIQEFGTNGTALGTFATGLSGPADMAFNSTGDMFVSEMSGGTIKEFDSSGNLLGTFASGLNSPLGLTFDNAGNLYEVDHGTGFINEFAANGTLINSFYADSFPLFIAFNPVAVSTVPEPSALWLLGIGGLVLSGYAWRKKKSTV